MISYCTTDADEVLNMFNDWIGAVSFQDMFIPDRFYQEFMKEFKELPEHDRMATYYIFAGFLGCLDYLEAASQNQQ